MIKNEHNSSLKSFNSSMKHISKEQDFSNPYYKNTKLPALYKPPVQKGHFKYDTHSQISGSTANTSSVEQKRGSMQKPNKNQFYPGDLLVGGDSAKPPRAVKKRTNTTENLNHSKSVADDYSRKPYTPQFKHEKHHNYLLPFLS